MNRFERAIRDAGDRRRGPFEYLRVTGMPDPLVASELVGHRAGSFQGAVRDKRGGLVWRAHRGTLVLDGVRAFGERTRDVLTAIINDARVGPLGAAPDETAAVDLRVIPFAQDE